MTAYITYLPNYYVPWKQLWGGADIKTLEGRPQVTTARYRGRCINCGES
jgi:hypothetical protein